MMLLNVRTVGVSRKLNQFQHAAPAAEKVVAGIAAAARRSGGELARLDDAGFPQSLLPRIRQELEGSG
jgi:hypothetical protein